MDGREMNGCTECRFCNVGKYHAGKWYCSSPNVSIFNLPADTNKCFEKRERKRKMGYRPKTIEGRIKNTGWTIDGHTLILTSWDYDDYESWHLCAWKKESEKAIIETMFITETEAGMCLYGTLEEFTENWAEWEPQGSFCIPLENVEVVRIIQGEVKEK